MAALGRVQIQSTHPVSGNYIASWSPSQQPNSLQEQIQDAKYSFNYAVIKGCEKTSTQSEKTQRKQDTGFKANQPSQPGGPGYGGFESRLHFVWVNKAINYVDVASCAALFIPISVIAGFCSIGEYASAGNSRLLGASPLTSVSAV